MRKTLLLAMALFALPTTTRAQLAFAPQVSWGSESDVGVGARAVVHLPLILSSFQVFGSADYFFRDCGPDVDCTWIEFNANATVPLPIIPLLGTYIGGGLNWARVDDGLGDGTETRRGYNVIGGVKLPAVGFRPFAEARFTFDGADQFVVTAGVLFGG